MHFFKNTTLIFLWSVFGLGYNMAQAVNPVLPDFHADPEIMYSNQTGKFYIYSTTDGVPGWGGYYFQVFSSRDLVNWYDEGIMLDVKSDQVKWASGNAWAPAIEEIYQDEEYKYYFYFSGNAGKSKQIGVAVSDYPTGPFTDLGQPLIATSPAGYGQQIDVDVFTDPVSGKHYIYWGNGYLAVAELNSDMVSIREGSTQVITPKGGTLQDYNYREGAYVFFRNGLYYFLWSVDDTGSTNYHVAYGTSTSPTGPIKVADSPIVIMQQPNKEIYGTGHNAVLQIPGKDEWYIVYHRINKDYLKDKPGVHREVCIDKMEFNADGTIKPVMPTHEGVLPITQYASPISANAEPMETGKFEPTWQSLSQYEVPEWFQNAKFGIWAHWGPQCQPEAGDWYARGMYSTGSGTYRYHNAHYGNPAEFGFKDVINEWKADKWNPEELVKLYKRVGAQYFFAMANHHDNMDLWDSKYQPWNSVNMGPKQDILARWAKAAHKNKLPFGLSVHAAHAWTWYETSQKYDGKLTVADGKGLWWEGYDPQDLYEQKHPLSKDRGKRNGTQGQWEWENGANLPSAEYCTKFYNRTVDMINRYNPDLLYFDDTALPLFPVSDAGLKIAAHYYNHNMATHNGKLEAVMFGKKLNEEQKQAMVWDVEKGAPDQIQEKPWQSCTCIGDWHYNRGRFTHNSYKSAEQVILSLVDIVSKNGSMLLNIPMRGDGSIDSLEIKILENIAAWMDVNKESIFDTHPWKIFGEGASATNARPIKDQGFNEGGKQTAADIRFNQKGKTLYITCLGIPEAEVSVKSCGKTANLLHNIKKVEMLGSKEKIKWQQTNDALQMSIPQEMPCKYAVVYKITTK